MNSPQPTPPSSRSNSPIKNIPIKRVNAWPDEGTFAPHPDHIMLKNMWDAINKLNLWIWLLNTDIERIMFSNTEELTAIGKETDVMGHTPATFAFCISHMNIIAKHGWVEYYRNNIHPHFIKNI
jgi:hypothetical protein